MAKSYLDYDGLLYLWQKIKTLFATKDEATTSAAGLMSSTDKTKLNGIATGAEVNQNAFGIIKVTSTDCSATTESDTFTIAPGNNITLTATTKGVIINGPTGITNAQSQKLAGIAAGAEVNQNAFSNVKVGDDTIAADGKTDTLTLTAGSNVTLTADTTNDKVTIAATDTTYSDFTGATSSTAGTHGLVPAPNSGSVGLALLSDGNWGILSSDHIRIGNLQISLTNAIGSKANLASPAFTGTPTAPTAAADTNNTQIATTAFVTTAITNAIASVQGIQYSVVASLPATGAVGTIYLVSNSGSGQNIYDEYIWVNNGYEKIGTTDVDLTGYLQTTDVLVITNAQIDTILAT